MLSPDQPRHRLGNQEREEIIEALLGDFMPGFLDALRAGVGEQAKPRQQTHPVIVPTQGELVGDGLEGTEGIAQFHTLVIAKPAPHDRSAVAVGHLHRERGFAETRSRLDPENPRRRLMVQPVLIGVEDPLAPGEPFQIARKSPLETRGIQCPPQHLSFRGKAPCLPFDPADDFEELLLIEALEVEILLVAELTPTAQIRPLEMGDGNGNAF